MPRLISSAWRGSDTDTKHIVSLWLYLGYVIVSWAIYRYSRRRGADCHSCQVQASYRFIYMAVILVWMFLGFVLGPIVCPTDCILTPTSLGVGYFLLLGVLTLHSAIVLHDAVLFFHAGEGEIREGD